MLKGIDLYNTVAGKLCWRLDLWFLEIETGDMEVNVLNKHKMLMMLSAVLMASSLSLIISNYTGAMEYSKNNTVIYAGLFAVSIFFFVKNMRKSGR